MMARTNRAQQIRAVAHRPQRSRGEKIPLDGFVGCCDRDRLARLLFESGYRIESRGSILPRPFALERQYQKPLWFFYWVRDDGSQFELLDEYDSPFARDYGACWVRELAVDLGLSPLTLLARVRRR